METPEQLSFLKTLLPLAGVIFIIAVGVALLTQQFHKNLYRQKLQQEELKNLHQVELLKSSIQVQEDERKRIAQDIHDELGAVLSISKMHLLQLENNARSSDTGALPALQNIRSLTETAIASMRRISHELMPPQLETFGLVKTLEAVAAQANKTGGIEISIIAAEHLPELAWPVKLGLYRICMELINNTIKHAEAKTIVIQLNTKEQNIQLTYTDDGKGLPENTAGAGLGQKSIEGRVNAMNGSIRFNGAEGGLKVYVSIPLEKKSSPVE